MSITERRDDDCGVYVGAHKPGRNVMPKLIYSMAVSLDGYTAGPDGRHDWSAPDPELHRFHNEQTEQLRGHLMGRRLYEDMLPWETAQQHGVTRSEFAEVWSAIPKVVFSTTLKEVQGNATLARGSVAEEVAALKAQVGGGTPFLPALEHPIPLELLETRRLTPGSCTCAIGAWTDAGT